MNLSPRQRRFVAEYLIDHNASQAAIRSGYSKKNADVVGPRLLGNVGIKSAIEEGDRKVNERCEISAEAVATELAKIAFSDPRKAFQPDGMMLSVHELPDDIAASIRSIKTNEDGDIEELEFWSKPQALELLGDRQGMFKKVHEITGKGGRPISIKTPSIDLSKYADAVIEKLANGNGHLSHAGR